VSPASVPPVRVLLGADEVGNDLHNVLAAHLGATGGVHVSRLDSGASAQRALDVPEIARAVAEAILRGEADRGILICGSGVGMVIAANKVPGIRAAQCHDVYTARHARNSDDVQVIVLGSRVIGVELAKVVVDAWLAADFEPNEIRLRRLAKMAAIDASYHGDEQR
jgi:ribose 5-phosphate isomerase B